SPAPVVAMRARDIELALALEVEVAPAFVGRRRGASGRDLDALAVGLRRDECGERQERLRLPRERRRLLVALDTRIDALLQVHDASLLPVVLRIAHRHALHRGCRLAMARGARGLRAAAPLLIQSEPGLANASACNARTSGLWNSMPPRSGCGSAGSAASAPGETSS